MSALHTASGARRVRAGLTSGTAPALRGSAVFACFALLAALLAACDDDLPKATVITHLRILGASLQVVGDETRATPKPGEQVRVSLATVFPSLPIDKDTGEPKGRVSIDEGRVHALIVSCTAPDRYTGGIPICQELIDAATSGVGVPSDLPAFVDTFSCDGTRVLPLGGPLSLNCTSGAPVVELPVPSDYTRDRLLFAGVVCERGAAIIDPMDPQLFGCADPDVEAIRVHGLIPVQQRKVDENHNPEIDALSMQRELNGEWLPADPTLPVMDDEKDCLNVARDLPNPSVLPTLYGHVDFRLIYDASAREKFEGEPEQLEISLYTTQGEVERRFTLFEPSDRPNKAGELISTIRYTPPKKDIPEKGGLIRFYATLRDQRGGFAINEYALCLGP